ncbi:MAG: hypothetical protein DRJ18_02245 [Candidatus Methanomethylicota archaeon]|nr:MAG: hypothetical protein DRJ18_02245 [Candidatus Verstraetearchaeota archaeon]
MIGRIVALIYFVAQLAYCIYKTCKHIISGKGECVDARTLALAHYISTLIYIIIILVLIFWW